MGTAKWKKPARIFKVALYGSNARGDSVDDPFGDYKSFPVLAPRSGRNDRKGARFRSAAFSQVLAKLLGGPQGAMRVCLVAETGWEVDRPLSGKRDPLEDIHGDRKIP
jgi:hypothetical protein